MKLLSIFLSIVLIALTLSQCKIRESLLSEEKKGGVDGNGGGNIVDELNPWFVGSEPVKYCVRHDAGAFSVPLEKAQVSIRKALDEWVKTINDLTKLNPQYATLPVKMSVEYVEGPCDATTELEFLLGTFNDHVEEKLREGSKIKVAFASRYKQSEPEVMRKKGLVWLSPDRGPRGYAGKKAQNDFWQITKVLETTTEHELGHVFGMSHGTILLMMKDTPKYLVEKGDLDLPNLSPYDLYTARLNQSKNLGCFEYIPLSDTKIDQAPVLDKWLGFTGEQWCIEKEVNGKDVSIKISIKEDHGKFAGEVYGGAVLKGRIQPTLESISGLYRRPGKDDVKIDFLHFVESFRFSGTAKIKGVDIPAKLSSLWLGSSTLRLELMIENEWYQLELIEPRVEDFLVAFLKDLGSLSEEKVIMQGGQVPGVSGTQLGKAWQPNIGIAELSNRWGKKLDIYFVEGNVSAMKITCDVRDGHLRVESSEGSKARMFEVITLNKLGVSPMTQAVGGPRAMFGTIDKEMDDWATKGSVRITKITETEVEGEILDVSLSDGKNTAKGKFKVPLCRYRGWLGVEE